MEEPYSFVFPSAFALAHLALAAAESLALIAGLLRQSFFFAGLAAACWAFALAQRIFRAFARAFTSLRRWAADMRYLRLAGVGASSASALNGVGTSPPGAMESSWLWSDSICSLMARIWRSLVVVRLLIFVIREVLMLRGVWCQSGKLN